MYIAKVYYFRLFFYYIKNWQIGSILGFKDTLCRAVSLYLFLEGIAPIKKVQRDCLGSMVVPPFEIQDKTPNIKAKTRYFKWFRAVLK